MCRTGLQNVSEFGGRLNTVVVELAINPASMRGLCSAVNDAQNNDTQNNEAKTSRERANEQPPFGLSFCSKLFCEITCAHLAKQES